ncbi:MAG: acyltransferase [Verrucomicrobiota bacterium]|nr:acyltransferase [Verrucomicrobiota bacterium]
MFFRRVLALFLSAGSGTASHIPSLDGARGLAVLMVLLDHASDEKLRLFASADLNRLGKYGVYLFFVLSAFLLTYPFWLHGAERLRSVRTWANYFLRRFLRIFPLYALVLIVYVINEKLSPAQLGDHLLLRSGRWHFWTIPVEFKFYFVLPLVVFAVAYVLRKSRGWGMVAIAAVALLLHFVLAPLERAWTSDDNMLLATTLQTFLMGSAAGFLYAIGKQRGIETRRYAIWFEATAVLALVFILLRVPSIYNAVLPFTSDRGKFGYDATVCGAVWSIFLLAILHGTGHVRRALEWPALRYLGLISYGAYLWHRKFLNDVDDLPVPAPLRLGIFILLVVAVASVTYFLIERPLSRIRLQRRATRGEAAANGERWRKTALAPADAR